jgi:hypothetical protein
MKLRRTIALASVVLGVTALASPGCGNSGLVGGGCADGLTNCSNLCVDLQGDQYNCGRCGHACVSGVACIHGKCGGVDEVGGTGWGGAGGGGGHFQDGSLGGSDASSDATGDHIVEFDVNYPQGGNTSTGGSGTGGDSAGGPSNGGSSSTGGATNGGMTATGGTGEPDADPCVPPYNDPQHCGDCTTVCPVDTPVCAPSSGSYECRPVCELPLVNCNGSCADLNSDSTNCGYCGNECPSTVCQGGACVGAQAGHFVGICMNYRTPAAKPSRYVLGASIFVKRTRPVRILAYDEFSDKITAEPQVEAELAQIASDPQFGPITIAHISQSADLPNVLRKSDYDVFLVYEQPNAPTGVLTSVGDLWASSLESFTYVGGVVVVLDGGQGVREMSQFLTSARLFPATNEVPLSPGAWLSVSNAADAVGTNLFDPLQSQSDTCVFETSTVLESRSVVVVDQNDAGTSRPVVVHFPRSAPQK